MNAITLRKGPHTNNVTRFTTLVKAGDFACFKSDARGIEAPPKLKQFHQINTCSSTWSSSVCRVTHLVCQKPEFALCHVNEPRISYSNHHNWAVNLQNFRSSAGTGRLSECTATSVHSKACQWAAVVGNGYLSATPGDMQAGDTGCTAFTLDSLGRRTPDPVTSRCW